MKSVTYLVTIASTLRTSTKHRRSCLARFRDSVKFKRQTFWTRKKSVCKKASLRSTQLRSDSIPFLRLSPMDLWYTVKTKPRFGECYIPVLGVKPKRGYVFWLFFKAGQCSAFPFKRSRRELSIDVAKHRSTLKNYLNTYYLRFGFIPKT